MVLCSKAISEFLDVSMCSSLWNANGLRITQESRKMQASPRVDVDEAPCASNAPGTDLLFVTELGHDHDSIELLNSDWILYTETLPISDSDGTSGQCKKTCLRGTYSAQLIAGIIMSQLSTFFDARIEIARSALQREWLELDAFEALRGLLNVRKISSVFSSSQICQTRALLEVLNHATVPISVRRSVVCNPNMSTFRAFPSLCVSLCLLTRLYTAIHRPLAPTHLHVSQAP